MFFAQNCVYLMDESIVLQVEEYALTAMHRSKERLSSNSEKLKRGKNSARWAEQQCYIAA